MKRSFYFYDDKRLCWIQCEHTVAGYEYTLQSDREQANELQVMEKELQME